MALDDTVGKQKPLVKKKLTREFLVELSGESFSSQKSTSKEHHLNYSGVNYTIGEAYRSTFTDQVGPRQSYNTLNTDISLVLFSQIYSYIADFGGRKEKTKRESVTSTFTTNNSSVK